MYIRSTFLRRAVIVAATRQMLRMPQGTTRANLMVTYRRRPTKEARMPCVALTNTGDCFNRWKKGAVPTRSKKEGVKIAMVATMAPESPCTSYAK